MSNVTDLIKAEYAKGGAPLFKLSKGDLPGHEFHGNQWKDGSGKIIRMNYREFAAAGHKEADWEEYRQAYNAQSHKENEQKLIGIWNAGEKMNGIDLINLLANRDITAPEKLHSILSHSDTTASKTSVEGRGVSRSDAKAVHVWVSQQMGALK